MNALSVNPKLVTPAVGQVWIRQSAARNPFNRKKHEVTITAVKNQWVRYCFDLERELCDSKSFNDFRQHYQPERHLGGSGNGRH